MGPDTSLAQTLISAVRLSGNVGRWEGGKARRVQSGLHKVHAEVLRGAV